MMGDLDTERLFRVSEAVAGDICAGDIGSEDEVTEADDNEDVDTEADLPEAE